MRNKFTKKILIGAITIIFALIYFVITNQSNAATVVGTWDVSADDGESNVTATLYDDGNFIISGTGAMKDEQTYKDKRVEIKTAEIQSGVTRIGGCAFEECIGLESIEIPSSVTSIGNFAFFNCRELTQINIPDSIENIEYTPFDLCVSLINIEVDENNQKYSSENGVLFNKNKTKLICYPAGKKDSEYTIPNSVTIIGTSAFYCCTNLSNINILNSVQYISGLAFYKCNNLINIVIPSSVRTLSLGAFSNCYGLKSIEVHKDNTYYSSENGVVFNKDKRELICYPAGKEENEYTIPECVTNIESYAFEACRNLINIKIPSSVISIDPWVFSDCYALKSIEVDKGNTNYSSEKGVLFNKDKTKLIRYPEGKKEEQYEIPESVIDIMTDAFKGVEFWVITEQNSNSIVLPELIKRVKDENDIVIVLKNCNFDENEENLLIDTDKIQAGEYATIQINSGELEGLTFYITNGVWDISQKGDKSVLATLSKDGVLTISGKGRMIGFSPYQPYREFIDRIHIAKIEQGVTNIDYGTFAKCNNLTRVEIPSSVTNIGYGAFYECSSLTSIEIPSSVTSIDNIAFKNCSSLASIVIPDSVTSIGDDTFDFCQNLTIYCKDNSYAKQYAKENNIKYVVENIKNPSTDNPSDEPTDNPSDNTNKTNTGNKKNNNSFSTSTIATRKLPYAGIMQKIVLPIGTVLTIIASIVTYIGYRKYKVIK